MQPKVNEQLLHSIVDLRNFIEAFKKHHLERVWVDGKKLQIASNYLEQMNDTSSLKQHCFVYKCTTITFGKVTVFAENNSTYFPNAHLGNIN